MTEWFFHDPAEGRVGPLDTDALRERYRQRRITRDTLVWHAGMREWQPLDTVSDAVGIDAVVPDASLPPPLPAHRAPGSASTSAGRAEHTRSAPPPRRGLSGCAIAALVLLVLAIPLAGILAAIALPAYQQYTVRSKIAQGVVDTEALARAVAAQRAAGGTCRPPANTRVGTATLHRIAQRPDGSCVVSAQLDGMPPKVGRPFVILTEVPGAAWACSVSMEDRYVPSRCSQSAPPGPP